MSINYSLYTTDFGLVLSLFFSKNLSMETDRTVKTTGDVPEIGCGLNLIYKKVLLVINRK